MGACTIDTYGASNQWTKCTKTNPCLNGGVCSDDVNNGPQCACATGYTGAICDTCATNYHFVNNACTIDTYGAQNQWIKCTKTDPCLNGSTCSDDVDNGPQCACVGTFYGSVCQNTKTANTTMTVSDTFDNNWNADYNDPTSTAYAALIADLKAKIIAELAGSNVFDVDPSSIKILSVSPTAATAAAPTVRRRRNTTPLKVAAQYEFVAQYDDTKYNRNSLATAVAQQANIAATKIIVSSATQLSGSLMVAFVTMMVFF